MMFRVIHSAPALFSLDFDLTIARGGEKEGCLGRWELWTAGISFPSLQDFTHSWAVALKKTDKDSGRLALPGCPAFLGASDFPGLQFSQVRPLLWHFCR